MPRSFPSKALCLIGFLTLSAIPPFQGLSGQAINPADVRVAKFTIEGSTTTSITGPAREGQYVGAVGAKAAWLGYETDGGEVWVHPLKVARDIRLSFKIPAYSDPIPGGNVARMVESRPEAHTITYSHAAFQVRQHIIAPRDLPGILMLLEVDGVVDLEIHVEFLPVMQYAWPGGMGGQYLFWDGNNRAFILSESLRKRNALIGSPWATEASAHPAHRLAESPSTFTIPVDAERANDEFIPIAIVGGEAPREEIIESYRSLLEGAEQIYEANRAWAGELEDDRLSVSGEPPSPASSPGEGGFTEMALEWAKVNLEEQRSCNPDLGCGLVAGWGPSGTSLRAGFGWYFGGDAAINSLAMDATGQWESVAEGLRFLARYQRDDGKIPHEISQSAGIIPWFEEFPYAYYHADTTPFWMLALWYYWRASGDDALLRELWPSFLEAYAWCLTVETDGDGIIENTTGGLGAIEVGGLGEGIHQDIYLTAVWIGALNGTSQMADFMGNGAMADQAREVFDQASQTLNSRYWRPEEGHLAFGILQNGDTNNNLTAWPGTALSFGLVDEEMAEGTLRQLASDAISSSWGARLLSTQSELFDPLHYNNGAVWPFMTGFVSWAQYRYRRPWAGYPLLRALQGLTFDFALGRHPENLSGAYYETMDATVPHQFFATSMVVTPLARGLLGWDPNAPEGKASLAPQPPPSWPSWEARNLKVGETSITVSAAEGPESAHIILTSVGPPIEIAYVQSIPLGAGNVHLAVNGVGGQGRNTPGLHDQSFHITAQLVEGRTMELDFTWEGGLSVVPPTPHLIPGQASGGLRVLDFTMEGDEWVVLLEGDGGSTLDLVLMGEPVVAVDGSAHSIGDRGTMTFPVEFPATGRVNRTLRLRSVR